MSEAFIGCSWDMCLNIKDPTDKKKRVGRCASCLLGKGPELRVEGSEAVSWLCWVSWTDAFPGPLECFVFVTFCPQGPE